MNIGVTIADFLLSEWLWSVTFDWYQVIIGIPVMFLLLRLFAGMRTVRALLIACSAYFVGFMLYFLIVSGILSYFMDVKDMMAQSAIPINPFLASIRLGIIYALMQSIFLGCIYYGSTNRIRAVVLVIWISNFLTALISYVLIVKTMAHLL
jgi:hypothetical protein